MEVFRRRAHPIATGIVLVAFRMGIRRRTDSIKLNDPSLHTA